MNLIPDLFSFAYVPSGYMQLDELAELAIPEPWRFRNPNYFTKNQDTPILERYIHSIFKKQAIDYNEERNPAKLPQSLWDSDRKEQVITKKVTERSFIKVALSLVLVFLLNVYLLLNPSTWQQRGMSL